MPMTQQQTPPRRTQNKPFDMSVFTSTVAAISTPPGKGGVALIRISGDDAFAVCERVFSPRGKIKFSDIQPRRATYGDICLDGRRIDDGVLTLYPAPNSFTGESVAEICCHGGVLITKTVLEAVLLAGAVPAGQGEFTRRAFVNGKLSLTDAEAIAGLLEAKSYAQLVLASSESRDKLSSEIANIGERLTTLLSSIYARIDYPEEDLGEFSDGESRDILIEIKEKIERLIRSYRTGRSVSEGITAVICGKPNAGKSTLYNLILGEDAAIVTDVAGTTRDVLTRSSPLGSVLLNLSDTAGIHESSDTVEKIGIERTMARISSSELVLAVFDTSRPFDGDDEQLAKLLSESGKTVISVLNKADIRDTAGAFDTSRLGALLKNSVTLSAKSGDTAELAKLVEELFVDGDIRVGEDAVVSSARQSAALKSALEYVKCAIAAYDEGLAADVASSDAERALNAISELEGRSAREDVIAEIFSKFCVGK